LNKTTKLYGDITDSIESFNLMPPHELDNHEQAYNLIKENSNLKVELEKMKKEKAMIQLELRST